MKGRSAYYPKSQRRHSVAMQLICCECKRRVTKTVVPGTTGGAQTEKEFLYQEFYRIGWRGVKTDRPICRRCRRW